MYIAVKSTQLKSMAEHLLDEESAGSYLILLWRMLTKL